MIRVTLMDGSTLDINRAEVREILPTSLIIQSPNLRPDIFGLVPYQGTLLPIHKDEHCQSLDKSTIRYVVVLKEKCLLTTKIPELFLNGELVSLDSEEDWEEELEKLAA